jgi:hypothetical protein
MLSGINFATMPPILKVLFGLLVLWYFVLVAGTIQYRMLKRKTVSMILQRADHMAGAGRERLPERLYEAVYPDWCDMVRRSAWFIPSKSELRPIPATAENVQMRFGFSPKWVRDCLHDKRPDLLTS